VSTLEKYGRTVYAAYLDVVNSYTEFNAKKTRTIDEYVAMMDEINAFEAKYGFNASFDANPAASYTVAGDVKLLASIDSWYISSLDEAVTAIEKINTTAGYTAAKADIIAAAKTIYDVESKYSNKKYPGLANAMVGTAKTTVEKALKAIVDVDASALTKIASGDDDGGAYTAYVSVSGGYNFDSSEANLAAIAAARTAFDAFIADYTFAHDAGSTAVSTPTKETLKGYETKLLAAEYNKANVPAIADANTAARNTKVQALLNNATVKVTTKALGNKKIRVSAKIDTASFQAIYDKMTENANDTFTVSYQFYKKTAKATSYKAGKVKDVNYTTFTGLKKGTKYNFQCKVIVKDADGNVVATKSYKGSTVGTRVAK
jgi:hypothetical protein